MSTRRQFIRSVGGASFAAPFFPHIVTADKTGTKPAIVGQGEHTYECHHNWGELPSHIKWTDTHGVAVDAEGLIYVKHRGGGDSPLDTIVVFDPQGKYVRSFGEGYWQGGHGIDIRKDGNQEFLYLCDTQHALVAKTTLKGEQVWAMSFPEACGFYGPKSRFSPTNIAFAPDGGFYVADGYGSNYIHQYDKDRKWVRSWGGTGDAEGKFKTPHGIWLDDRDKANPKLVVADRANARLQYFSLDGVHQSFVKDVLFPAHFDIRGDVLLVPDLHARVSLFDKDNKAIAHLGYTQEWKEKVLANNYRAKPDTWENGRFIHPHDACFDKDGNIFVAEWVATGRVTFMKKVTA